MWLLYYSHINALKENQEKEKLKAVIVSEQDRPMPPKNEAQLECLRCGAQVPVYPLKNNCEKCGGILEYKLNLPNQGEGEFSGALRFWRYK